MKTSELIEKLRAYADLFGVVNQDDDFDEDAEALEHLLLATANRLELAYDHIRLSSECGTDCLSCKHYKYDCDTDKKWEWAGDDI